MQPARLVLLKPSKFYQKKKGELFPKFPGGVEGHAAFLKKEGFEIDFSKNNPVVVGYESKISNFT